MARLKTTSFTLLGTICAMLASSTAFADTTSDALPISYTISTTYTSKYIPHGTDLNNDNAILAPIIHVGLKNTGVYFAFYGAFAVEDRDNFKDVDEYDFQVGYTNTVFGENTQVLAYDVSYMFLHFPDYAFDIDRHELGLGLTFPKLLPKIGATAPVLYAKMFIDRAVSDVGEPLIDNVYVKGGVGYTWPTVGENLSFYSHVDSYYNSGDPDNIDGAGITHYSLGTNGTLTFGPVGFTLGVNYQKSLEETINNEDDAWATFTVSYSK